MEGIDEARSRDEEGSEGSRARFSVSDRAFHFVLGALGVGALAVWMVSVGRLEIDDAYISFRYARNLADGVGLRFNPTEAPVEGISNHLWTVLVAPLTRAFDDPLSAIRWLGWFLLGLSLWSCTRLVRLGGGSGSARMFGAVLLLSSPGFIAWHFTGMETPLVVALATLGLLLLDSTHRSWWWSGLCLGLLATARIDAPLLVAAIIVGWALGRRVDGHEWRDVVNRAVPVTFLSGGLWGLALVARRAWFGLWFPNTYYAKLSGTSPPSGRGLEYLFDAALLQPWLWLVPAAVVFAAVSSARRSLGVPLAFATLASMAYVTRIGGDWMPFHRFIVPILPFGAVAIALATQRVARRHVSLAAAAILVASSVGSMHWLHRGRTLDLFAASNYDTEFGRAGGRALRHLMDEGGTFATSAAGTGPYVADRTTIDMLGLNDLHIARAPGPNLYVELRQGHWKGDGAYVLDHAPDVILFFWGRTPHPQMLISDAMIAFDPRFRANYVLRTHDIELDVSGFSIPNPFGHDVELDGYECEPSGFFVRCSARREAPLHLWVRAPDDARRTTAGQLASSILDAHEHSGAIGALAELERLRPDFERSGNGVLADAYEARYSFDARRVEQLSHAFARGQQRPGLDGKLFTFWISVDPRFGPALAGR